FPYYFEHQRLDWKIAEAYVTDYSVVDYDVTTNKGKSYISSHTSPESFGVAEEMFYVVGSDLQGAMGADFIPFSSESDASSVGSDYGGEVVRFDGITPAMLGR
ncbi:MAG: nitrous oxide reductase accessory protein NosL, partial [Halobacteria archaeon]|nr:nitrous oxide reductase accessory protein NosL [Halobacteria archaeon]